MIQSAAYDRKCAVEMDNSKYKQLVETLKSSILSGKYGNSNPFPSVRSLIRRHGLSNTTVLRALDELVRWLSSEDEASDRNLSSD